MENRIVEATRVFLIILFIYTATNKMLTLQHFESILGRFPAIKEHAKFISIATPVFEIVISIFLIIPVTNKLGLWAGLALMLLFTSYLAFALSLHTDLPCACGGVISKMNWNQHLYFNLTIIGLIIWAIKKKETSKKRVQDMLS